MKLNPSKCTFRVNVGKFLGFMVTQRRIEVNPDQIKAVIETFAPSSKKELQRLIGKLATLGRFIARFTDKLRSLFLALKRANTIRWTEECQSVFEEIKRYLTQPPSLSSPQLGEQLYMYLVVSNCAVSVVLFRFISEKEQKPIYYISKAMVDAETRYSKMEQTALALRCAAQKLCLYFQAHQIIVLTNQPLKSILHKLDLSGRMLKWAIDLSEYRIKYQPRLSIKSQVMVDFIAKTPQSSQLAEPCREGWSILHVDGASRALGSEVGLLLQTPIRE